MKHYERIILKVDGLYHSKKRKTPVVIKLYQKDENVLDFHCHPSRAYLGDIYEDYQKYDTPSCKKILKCNERENRLLC